MYIIGLGLQDWKRTGWAKSLSYPHFSAITYMVNLLDDMGNFLIIYKIQTQLAYSGAEVM